MSTLADRIAARIRAGGPLPFEEFMEAALYDPGGGFFGTGPLRSVRSGDFLTSPEVSDLFGRTLARFVAAERRRLGDPPGFVVVDVGAGSGSLLRPLLEEAPADGWAVEVSPAARAELASVVGPGRVVSAVAELPERLEGVVVANELVDNLPVSLAVRTAGGWEERWVAVAGDGFALESHPARAEVAAWAELHGATAAPGDMVEVQLAAGRWLERMLDRLKRGSVLVIDYGGTSEELAPRRTRGTLRTYRSHHLGPDPLTEPGETDITVDVDFSALAAVAAAAGAEVEVQRQDDFLAAWGLRDHVGSLRRRELELAATDPMERLSVRSERTDAEALLHPRGLGDFRVLVARTA
jgi:SAM-dependent MidA family methyltransferase